TMTTRRHKLWTVVREIRFIVRHRICELLEDGRPARDILQYANATNQWQEIKARYHYDDINTQNLSEWRSGGFKEWKNERAKVERLRAVSESAFHIAAATGGDPAAVGSRILAGRLTELLETLDEEHAPEIARALASLRKGENDAQRLELDRKRSELAEQSLALEREKFRRQTCEMFLKWYADRHASAIAEGPGTNAEKIAALLAYMDEQEAGEEIHEDKTR
ncbi:MAG: hypothetical protein ACI4QT_03500, partial [Kiritimatiellia bacterium]